MSSPKERKLAFVPPTFPKFDRALNKLLKQVEQKAASTNSELDPDPIYYVYVLLDPRKPGPFDYTLPGGKVITFKFQPFYAGKGKGDRFKVHVKSTRKRVAKGRKLTHKENTIKNIESLDLKVIEKRVSVDLTEAEAFAKEIMLISTIGRVDLGTGVLTNWSGGGEGVIDLSPETIRRHSEAQKRVRASLTPKQNVKRNKLTRESVLKAWDEKSPEDKETHRQKTIDQMASMSDEERKNLTANARKAYRKLLKSLTDEERTELLGTGSRERWASLTEEEREAQNKKTGAAIRESIAAWSEEKKELVSANRSKAQRGRLENMTPEEREAERERKRAANKAHLDSLPLETCEHCGFQGKGNNMKRWHHDNCKHNPNKE